MWTWIFSTFSKQKTLIEGNLPSSGRTCLHEAFRHPCTLLHDVSILRCQHHHILRCRHLPAVGHHLRQEHMHNRTRRYSSALHNSRKYCTEKVWTSTVVFHLGCWLLRHHVGHGSIHVAEGAMACSRRRACLHLVPGRLCLRLHHDVYTWLFGCTMGDDRRVVSDESQRFAGRNDLVHGSLVRIYRCEDVSNAMQVDSAAWSFHWLRNNLVGRWDWWEFCTFVLHIIET